MSQATRLRKQGLAVEAVGDILDETDADRAARAEAALMSNAPVDPFEALKINVDDAYEEAKGWLNGAKVENQEQADALGKLYTMLDEAEKASEAQRKAEKQPHLDAGNAVDKRYKPLVDRAGAARKAVKTAVQRWNDHLAELLRIEAERVRKEAADAAERAAKLADDARAENNLAAMEMAETQIANAETLADMAKRAENAKAVTKTAGARGIGTVPMRWVGRLNPAEPNAAQLLARHYWQTRHADVMAFYLEQARRDVAAGARQIPGLTITQEKVA
jgi:hypothetical protein